LSNNNLLHVVIPCYNPSENWEDELLNYFTHFKQKLPNHTPRLTLVVDGISAFTQEKNLAKISSQLPDCNIIVNPENHGKGHALRTGVQSINEGLILFTDVDFPYQVDSMLLVAAELSKGTDVVLGYREQSYYDKVPAFRKALSKLFRWSLVNILKLKISDTQCGLKGFNSTGRDIFLSTTINRFLFDLEFVKYSSSKKDVTIQSVKVNLRDEVVFSTMNIQILLKEAFNFLWVLTKR